MAIFVNPAGRIIVNDSGNPIDCTDCPCEDFGRCEDFCDPLGPEEYTVTFFGATLTNEGCGDCSVVLDTPFVLTFGSPGDVCGNFTCCWGYEDIGCELAIVLVVQNELVILTVLIGPLIEAQWVWDRGSFPASCVAGTISSNIAWDTGDEIQCSGWINLNVSVE